MKNNYSREWLENYKTIPKRDNAIYKNYQNPGMSTWDRQMASLSAAQRNRYNEFLNTIPNELQGLSAAEMQKYLQEINQKQNALTQEKAGYENQIQNIKNQEAQRQAQLKVQQDRNKMGQMNRWRQENFNSVPMMRFRSARPHIEYLMNTGLPFNEAFEKMMQNDFYAGNNGSYFTTRWGSGDSLANFLRTYGLEGFKFLGGHVGY